MKTQFHLSTLFLSAYFLHILHERVSNSLPHLPFIIPSSFCSSPYFQTHIYRQELNIRNRRKEQQIWLPYDSQ